MIELIQVHEPNQVKKSDINYISGDMVKSDDARYYRKTITMEDGSIHKFNAPINMKYGKLWNEYTDSVNRVFGNPDSELRNRKITFQEYADMKTNYNNRMVTDYEKESKPAEPPPMERTKANFYGKMGGYDLKDGGITLEPNATKPLPWSQRFFRFFGRR